jgi:DNA-binding NarL/FixJ family response regulator
LSGREIEVLVLASRGEPLKAVGYDLGLSESTIACHLRECARKLGVGNRLDLIRITQLLTRTQADRIHHVPLEQHPYALLCVDVPTGVRTALTAAQRQVVTLALHGLSDREIARTRNTAVSTVANQLRDAFTRLGVRSRAELAAR